MDPDYGCDAVLGVGVGVGAGVAAVAVAVVGDPDNDSSATATSAAVSAAVPCEWIHYRNDGSTSTSSTTKPIDTAVRLPEHVEYDILNVVVSSSSPPSRDMVEIESIQECKSAQQKVYIVRCRVKSSTATLTNNTIIINNDNVAAPTAKTKSVFVVVVRMWTGGSCWWNLHRNDQPSIHLLAESEIMGYNVARRAFDYYYYYCRCLHHHYHPHPCIHPHCRREPLVVHTDGGNDGDVDDDNFVTIPHVYQFVNNTNDGDEHQTPPYAILEYVGPGSFLLMDDDHDHDNHNYATKRNCDSDEVDNVYPNQSIPAWESHSTDGCLLRRRSRHQPFRASSSYEDNMINNRHEFGFDEPHPRWGRLPTGQALEYAKLVLHNVVLPIHTYCFDHKIKSKVAAAMTAPDVSSLDDNDLISNPPFYIPDDDDKIRTYAGMVHLYRTSCNEMMMKIKAVNLLGSGVGDTDMSRQKDALWMLDNAIKGIENIVPSILPPFAPVLVHLDLQPQNLKFGWCDDNGDEKERKGSLHQELPSTQTSNKIKVVAVLDWEDAAWADPRFEVLMLCRKVCANIDQADILWNEYIRWHNEYMSELARQQQQQQQQQQEQVERTMTDQTKDDNADKTAWDVGPIRPWLQLETIHSITTLLLQSMDLLNGGRNPWETESDLWGKLEREFARWEQW